MIRLRFHINSIFEQIKSGIKTVETRALNPDEPERYFGNIKVGETIELERVDNGEILRKKVKRASVYNNFDDYLKEEDFKKIFGKEMKPEEVRKIHYNFPGYKERLEKYGIVAFEFE